MKVINSSYLVWGLVSLFFLAGCQEEYTPKPRGYFRIQMPEKAYQNLDSIYPYQFEYPQYARVLPDEFSPLETNWINLDFPQFKGRLHISYKAVDGNLGEYLEDSRNFVMKHIPRASAIREELIVDPERKMYGMLYEIKGTGAASPMQFFVTDSTHHFLRAALYFTVRPNNDSLAPVIDFIGKDINQLINTIRWRSVD